MRHPSRRFCATNTAQSAMFLTSLLLTLPIAVQTVQAQGDDGPIDCSSFELIPGNEPGFYTGILDLRGSPLLAGLTSVALSTEFSTVLAQSLPTQFDLVGSESLYAQYFVVNISAVYGINEIRISIHLDGDAITTPNMITQCNYLVFVGNDEPIFLSPMDMLDQHYQYEHATSVGGGSPVLVGLVGDAINTKTTPKIAEALESVIDEDD